MNNKRNKEIKDLNSTRKHPAYVNLLGAMDARVKFAVEINKVRILKNWSQQELAKNIGTTQKVISKIENAEVNLGFNLIYKITKSLNFSSNDLAKFFDCGLVFPKEWVIDNTTESGINNKTMSMESGNNPSLMLMISE